MSQHFYHQDHARVLSDSLFENAGHICSMRNYGNFSKYSFYFKLNKYADGSVGGS